MSYQRRILLQSIIILFSFTGTLNAQNYMDAITEKSCDCLKNLPDSIGNQESLMRMGVCILDASVPYKKELKRDHNIDVDRYEESAEKLGGLIGLKMATKCPNALLKMAAMNEEDDSKALDVRGTLLKVENDRFIVFSVKDENGKVSKFYWLTFIESRMDLINKYKDLTGKKVKITYQPQEFFDPKLDEYRQFYIIKEMNLDE